MDDHQAQCPPSTRKSDAVIKLLPSPSKNSTGALNSSTVLSRFNILSPLQSSSILGIFNVSSVAAVRIYPGDNVFTLISGIPGLDPHSAARDRASCRTPDLDVLYAAVSTPLFTFVPLILATRTMLPLTLAWRISRATACADKNVPVTLMSMRRRNRSTENSVAGSLSETPAQATRPRMGCRAVEATADMACVTSSGLVTSHLWYLTMPEYFLAVSSRGAVLY